MFADDVVLCGSNPEVMNRELESWRRALEEKSGLKINRMKTVQLNFGTDRGELLHLDGQALNVVDKFKYLGSTVNKEGDLDCEIAHRVNAAWMNWKRMSGVLCDRRMNGRMRRKIYRTVVRPAMMYGSETWPVKRITKEDWGWQR
ncbi:hypothetical protein M8J77_022340 [Diaphorina citri]|nr:hypothetical protein M8J77_022340 [Diaphorina citri]